MKSHIFWQVTLFLTLGLSACSTSQNVFVLLPDDNGSVGQITVSNDQGTQPLSEAWQATVVNNERQAPASPKQLSQAKVESMFKDALAAQPQPARRYILYFKTGSTELTEKSLKLIPEILNTIEEKQSTFTSIIGHSDTAGDADYNLELSHQRAEIVGGMLRLEGVNPGILEISSHGEGNPLISTGDNVLEPRNRRVEITIR